MMMSSTLSSHFTKAPLLPFHHQHHQSRTSTTTFCRVSKLKSSHPCKLKAQDDIIISDSAKVSNLAILGSTILVAKPALAVTGVSYFDEDLMWTLAQLGISAFIYFLVVPSKMVQKGFSRYVRSVHVGVHVLHWIAALGTILDFRKFPRDPSMKYPWSRPENPSLIKSEYRKYPWATPEDYD